MREFSYTLDEVMNLGFYESYRLWSIQDELKARDLQHLSIIIDGPHVSEEKREELWQWFQKRQPRSHVNYSIPKEVQEHINRVMEQSNHG